MTAARWTTGLAWIAGLMGAVHTALTTLEHPQWSLPALWFLGSGVAMVVAALANGLGKTSAGRGAAILLAGINLAMAAFFAAAWTVLPAPQVIVGGFVFGALTVCAVLRHQVHPTQHAPG